MSVFASVCVCVCIRGTKCSFTVPFTQSHVHSHEGPLFLMEQVHIEVADSPLFCLLFDTWRRHCVLRVLQLWRHSHGAVLLCERQKEAAAVVLRMTSRCFFSWGVWLLLSLLALFGACWGAGACLPEPVCEVCTCMCMISSWLCCDRNSVILHVNVSGLHLNISVIIFVCSVDCIAYDEPFGFGQWHAPWHLSRQACLRLLCMGSRLIGTC